MAGLIIKNDEYICFQSIIKTSNWHREVMRSWYPTGARCWAREAARGDGGERAVAAEQQELPERVRHAGRPAGPS